MSHISGEAGMTGSAQQSQPDDDVMREQLHKTVSEAAERETFHRIEAERCHRMGLAAAAAIRELDAGSPMAQVTPDEYFQAKSQAVGAGPAQVTGKVY